MIALTVLIGAGLLLPADAAPLTGHDPLPRVAFVARNDIPFDAMSVGPVAGALGGVVVLTPSSQLGASARASLTEFAPDLVVLAGGTAALSPAVATDVEGLGTWDVRRIAGTDRDDTSRQINALLAEYGVERPVLATDGTAQVVGDAYVGGTLAVDGLTVQDPSAVRGVQPAMGDTVYVPGPDTATGGDAAIRDAVAAAGEEGIVEIGPGWYELDGPLTLPDGVWLLGSVGERTMLVFGGVGAASEGPAAAAVLPAGNAFIQDLVILAASTDPFGFAVYVQGGYLRLSRTVVSAVGGSSGTRAALYLASGLAETDDARATASAGANSGDAYGVWARGGNLIARDSEFSASSQNGVGYALRIHGENHELTRIRTSGGGHSILATEGAEVAVYGSQLLAAGTVAVNAFANSRVILNNSLVDGTIQKSSGADVFCTNSTHVPSSELVC